MLDRTQSAARCAGEGAYPFEALSSSQSILRSEQSAPTLWQRSRGTDYVSLLIAEFILRELPARKR